MKYYCWFSLAKSPTGLELSALSLICRKHPIFCLHVLPSGFLIRQWGNLMANPLVCGYDTESEPRISGYGWSAGFVTLNLETLQDSPRLQSSQLPGRGLGPPREGFPQKQKVLRVYIFCLSRPMSWFTPGLEEWREAKFCSEALHMRQLSCLRKGNSWVWAKTWGQMDLSFLTQPLEDLHACWDRKQKNGLYSLLLFILLYVLGAQLCSELSFSSVFWSHF